MKISKEYGPQYDPTDGTIGNLKLVPRFVLVKSDGFLFHAHQGRFSYATQGEAQGHCDAFLENQPEGHPNRKFVEGLRVECWWCYPNHFDPVGPIPAL